MFSKRCQVLCWYYLCMRLRWTNIIVTNCLSHQMITFSVTILSIKQKVKLYLIFAFLNLVFGYCDCFRGNISHKHKIEVKIARIKLVTSDLSSCYNVCSILNRKFHSKLILMKRYHLFRIITFTFLSQLLYEAFTHSYHIM